MGTRVFVGRLSQRATERDVEDFFRGYGRINDVMLKSNFAFVEFDDHRDAEDAIHDLNGKDLLGDRVALELAKRPPHGRDAERAERYRGSHRDSRKSPPRDRSPPKRYSPPYNTRWKVKIENLSSHSDWHDLKEMFRENGFKVTFCDAHKPHRNEGSACFETESDMKKAIKKLDGHEVNGRAMKIIEDIRSKGGSRSRSRSPRARRSGSRKRSHSSSKSRSRSGSKEKVDRSRSASPAANGTKTDEKEEKDD